MAREVHRLNGRIGRSGLHYNKGVTEKLLLLIEEDTMNFPEIVRQIESILEV